MRNPIILIAAFSLLSSVPSHAQDESQKNTCNASDFQKVSPRAVRLIENNSTKDIQSVAHKASNSGFVKFSTIIFVWYDQDGRIFNAKLKESSNYPELDMAIIEHMKSSHVTGKCGIGLVPFTIDSGA